MPWFCLARLGSSGILDGIQVGRGNKVCSLKQGMLRGIWCFQIIVLSFKRMASHSQRPPPLYNQKYSRLRFGQGMIEAHAMIILLQTP
jgi:hypothetical protein